MGIYVTFEKISEDESGIRFRFGPGFDRMDRTLSFKNGGDDDVPVSEDGVSDPSFARAVGKIVRMREDTGEWPERGAFAS